jgi:cell shape-determining protein MreC
MLKVRKENRVLFVTEQTLPAYLNDGYDQVDEVTGEVIKRATGGRIVTVAELNKAIDRIEELEKELAAKEESPSQIADLKEEIKVLEAENVRLDKLAKQAQNGQYKPQR